MNISELKEKVQRIAENENCIAAVFLFGSHAEGFSNEKSDIDFGVVVGDGKTKVDLKEQLRLGIVFANEMKKEVDVVILNNASLAFSYQVLSKGFLVFERERDHTSNFIEYIMDMYFDFLPRIIRYKKEFDEGLRKQYGGSES